MEQFNAAAGGKKMNGGLIVVILLVLAAGGYWLATRPGTPSDGDASPTPSASDTPAAMEKKDVLTVIDAAASEIAFDFDSKLHDGSGRFAKMTATGSFDRSDFTKLSATLVIDASSIETGISARDNHLKSDAFFDVTKYPTLKFFVTKAESDGKQHLVTGDLTIREKTLPVTAPVSILENADGSVTLKGSVTINRRDWGSFKYDEGSPMNPVSNELPIHITLVYR
ncbi:MAG: hypothetical protein G01um101431_928 [Parcubacteria group bacterium Gr01-1014_31]|nr:MAG: hypothetical protein G01um101431_928 [Parcubacteria group bacterium Gr01-1014_31]